MTTIIFNISRLVRNARELWSLRCGEGYSQTRDAVSALAHFQLEGTPFASGIPAAFKDGDRIAWTVDGNESQVKLNFTPEQSGELLNALLAIPELQTPPLNDDGVSTLRCWQLHVVVDDKAGVSNGDRGEYVLHWDSIESFEVVSASDETFARREHVKVNVTEIWSELGLKFEKPGKPVLTGEEAKEYLGTLKTRNERRRGHKAQRAASALTTSEKFEF